MSRGLSKMQQHIKGLLEGTKAPMVYGNPSGGLGTKELSEELREAGFIKTESDKVAMFTTWRACNSMFNRGLLEAEYLRTEAGDKTVSWSAKGK